MFSYKHVANKTAGLQNWHIICTDFEILPRLVGYMKSSRLGWTTSHCRVCAEIDELQLCMPLRCKDVFYIIGNISLLSISCVLVKAIVEY